MKYMIVDWIDNKWIILHYSHNWDDVQKALERHRRGNPKCELMLSYSSIITAEKKKEIMASLAPIMEGLRKFCK